MQIENREKMINNIKATMAVENQQLDCNNIKLLEDFADNKISMEDAMTSIKSFILGKV